MILKCPDFYLWLSFGLQRKVEEDEAGHNTWLSSWDSDDTAMASQVPGPW